MTVFVIYKNDFKQIFKYKKYIILNYVCVFVCVCKEV